VQIKSGNGGRRSDAVRGGAMAGEQRSSPALLVLSVPATVWLRKNSRSKRRRTRWRRQRGPRWLGDEAALGAAAQARWRTYGSDTRRKESEREEKASTGGFLTSRRSLARQSRRQRGGGAASPTEVDLQRHAALRAIAVVASSRGSACSMVRGKRRRVPLPHMRRGSLQDKPKQPGRHRHRLLHGVWCGNGLKKVLTDEAHRSAKERGKGKGAALLGRLGQGRAARPS